MKSKISKIIIMLILIITISSLKAVKAESIQPNLSGVEYSDEYKKWLELSDEERKNKVMPKMYDVLTKTDSKTYLKNMDNLFRAQVLMRASAVDSRFDLRDEIRGNVKIRNQLGTGLCWTFATIGALESNLGLKTTTEYDFSEKHMAYGTTRKAFNNGEVNKFGYSKEVDDGGNFYMATQYMASGVGAVDEVDMPFNESSDNINISAIQQADVKTTLYDTVDFETLPDNAGATEKNELMTQMKQHIVNYGGIYAGITGANMIGVDSNMYNNVTGAIYNNNADDLIDHAVTIIGWDDNYSVNNFNENQRPQNNGAWIIKNSWGSSISSNLTSLKEEIFNANPDMFKGQGINTASEIPNETIINAYEESFGEGKVNIQEDNLVIEIGEKGYMYISYEDKKIYKELYGVEKALYGKEYKNIYQNDELIEEYDYSDERIITKIYNLNGKMLIINEFDILSINGTEVTMLDNIHDEETLLYYQDENGDNYIFDIDNQILMSVDLKDDYSYEVKEELDITNLIQSSYDFINNVETFYGLDTNNNVMIMDSDNNTIKQFELNMKSNDLVYGVYSVK